MRKEINARHYTGYEEQLRIEWKKMEIMKQWCKKYTIINDEHAKSTQTEIKAKVGQEKSKQWLDERKNMLIEENRMMLTCLFPWKHLHKNLHLTVPIYDNSSFCQMEIQAIQNIQKIWWYIKETQT